MDTHALIWFGSEKERIAPDVYSAIVDEANMKFVSAASVWESEVKRAAGRLTLPRSLAEEASAAGFIELPLRFSHAAEAAALPRLHKDPFDRMLIGQARVENLTLVTADATISRYDVPVLRTAAR